MLKLDRFDKYLPLAALVLVLILVYGLYFPGAHGGFLFDDFPNLKELGTYGGVTDVETFKNFVFNGVASPLGRPLSLASFLLDDNTWPTHAEWFKFTNVKIHLLVGLFLCWCTIHLMRLFSFSETRAAWIAVLSAGLWMLHPYMISTTLYVVQRMAQLAAMFVFMGLTGYLYGRLLLAQNKLIASYVWMSSSLVVGTSLALLSKENGILLPVMVLAIEFCLPASLPKLKLWWKLLFFGIPCLVILFILAREINFAPDAWPARNFSQPERLLTEPRIIWEYLYHIYIPRIEGRGLFQDGYIVSKNLFDPFSTFYAAAGLLILFAAAVALRRRTPFFSLSILFYFTSHLLESSVLGLELYFEHRNYVSAGFLFLPLTVFLVNLESKGKLNVSISAGLLIVAALSFLTWQRSNLWSDTRKLEMYWAASTPESPRAQNKIGSTLLGLGKVDESIDFMEKSLDRLPQSSLLAVNTLYIKLHAGRATEADFWRISQLMKQQPFDAQAVVGLRNLVEKLNDPNMNDSDRIYMLNFLDEVAQNASYNKMYLFQKLIPYLKAQLYLASKDYDNAYKQFSIAIPMYSETDAALSMVAIMANAERPVEAYMLFKQAEQVFKTQPDKTLKRSRELYNREFKRMENTLEESLRYLGVEHVDAPSHTESAK